MDRNYESMFIVDPAVASKDWNKVTEQLEGTVTRYGAKIAWIKKWAERKLSFPIRKQQRGTYVLGYFTGPTEAINKIRDDLQLSETVLRFIIIEHEGEIVSPEQAKLPSGGEIDRSARRPRTGAPRR